MKTLPPELSALSQYDQFILWVKRGAEKYHMSPHTMRHAKSNDPSTWSSAEVAFAAAKTAGFECEVGYVFSKESPVFFLDIDNCISETGAWSDIATELVIALAGAAVETSASGRGLHIFGMSGAVDHCCKNTELGIELYTDVHFAAVTGVNISGDAGTDHTAAITRIASRYFPPKKYIESQDWTSEPEENGLTDVELVVKALTTSSAGAAFGGRATFRDLWEANADVLAVAYPDNSGNRDYDGSSADAALAQHLAFWTGKNCERMLRLIHESSLNRTKWEREGYLEQTILHAVSLQGETVYGHREPAELALTAKYEMPELTAKSSKQREYAGALREQLLMQCSADEESVAALQGVTAASVFLEESLRELPAMLEYIAGTSGPTPIIGPIFLSLESQKNAFGELTYLVNHSKILTPNGSLLNREAFTNFYSFGNFSMDGDTVWTDDPWKAFVRNPNMPWPKADTTCFDPTQDFGHIGVSDDSLLTRVNTYRDAKMPCIEGDVTLFIEHMDKLFPEGRDVEILTSYLAFLVQHKGRKSDWAIVLQGGQGCGKSIFRDSLIASLGGRYVKIPDFSNTQEKFNEWLYNTLLVVFNEVPPNQRGSEVLEKMKSWITDARGMVRRMGVSAQEATQCANFIAFTNNKDAIPMDSGVRRYCVMYSVIQTEEDLTEACMGPKYFNALYHWLEEVDGYAKIHHYLKHYDIPIELHPLKEGHRAPRSSSYKASIKASASPLSQAIAELIFEGYPGLYGGYVSTTALSRLLKEKGYKVVGPERLALALEELGYLIESRLNRGRTTKKTVTDGVQTQLYTMGGGLLCGDKKGITDHYDNAQQEGSNQ